MSKFCHLFIGLIAAVFVSVPSFAQSSPFLPSPTLSVGPEIALPVGNFGTFHTIGLGATVQYVYPLAARSALSLSTGYVHFTGKDFTLVTPGIDTAVGRSKAAGVVPIKAGFIYFLNKSFYVEPQTGISFISAGGGRASVNSSSTGFTYALNVGYRIEKLLVAARYESIASYGGSSFVGLRVAYVFGMGK